jgi:hypothetical protein
LFFMCILRLLFQTAEGRKLFPKIKKIPGNKIC